LNTHEGSLSVAYPLQDLDEAKKDQLVISYYPGPDGERIPVSLYGDTVWDLSPLIAHANVNRRRKVIDWQAFPERWRTTAKAVIHAFWLQSHDRYRRLDVAGLRTAAALLRCFMRWLDAKGIRYLSDEATPRYCSEYAESLKSKNDPRSVANALSMIERIYHYGKHLTCPMTSHPWHGRSGYLTAGCKPESSAR